VRVIVKYLSSSSKPTIDDLKKEQYKKPNRFSDVEDADFKEITPDDTDEGEKK